MDNTNKTKADSERSTMRIEGGGVIISIPVYLYILYILYVYKA